VSRPPLPWRAVPVGSPVASTACTRAGGYPSHQSRPVHHAQNPAPLGTGWRHITKFLDCSTQRRSLSCLLRGYGQDVSIPSIVVEQSELRRCGHGPASGRQVRPPRQERSCRAPDWTAHPSAGQRRRDAAKPIQAEVQASALILTRTPQGMFLASGHVHHVPHSR
jgi:hypothetical protein